MEWRVPVMVQSGAVVGHLDILLVPLHRLVEVTILRVSDDGNRQSSLSYTSMMKPWLNIRYHILNETSCNKERGKWHCDVLFDTSFS